MKQILILIAIVLVTLLTTTCKKYPDGGFTKRGPKHILGNWTLTLYEVNGIDSTNLINYNGNEDYKKIMFLKEQTKYSPHLYCRINNSFEMIMKFYNNNNALHFYSNGSPDIGKTCFTSVNSNILCYMMIFNPEQDGTDWDIIKLTKKELHIKCELKNSYRIKLKCTD